MTVLHLFGGRADFGVRMDIDPSTRPHVIADAWLPPFAEGSFDVVTLDPPYDLVRKLRPADHFVRGPAIKYNRWLLKNMLLPFDAPAPSDVTQ